MRLFRKPKMTFAEATVALDVAVRHGDTAQIRQLVATFPELLNTPNSKGACPLHWAAEAQSLASIECLIELGADPTRKDDFGYTAEQVAYWNGEFSMSAHTPVCLAIVERLRQAHGPVQRC